MKKRFCSMKNKFVLMVASLLLAFILATMAIWGIAFSREITERGVEYAGEIMKTANGNVESYLKKLRLIAYVLQNNSLAGPILNKTAYASNTEQLEDMKTMQLLLKSVMTGAEYMQNIYVYTQGGMEFSAGGSYHAPSEEQLEEWKRQTQERDVVFSVLPAADKYDYPKMFLVKQLDSSRKMPAAWVVMQINCRGIYGIYNEMERYDAGLIVWNDEKQETVYRNGILAGMEEAASQEERIVRMAQEENGRTVRLGGQKFLLMGMESEVTGWQSILLIPVEQVYGQHGRVLSINAVLLVLLSMSAVAASYVLAGRFLKNIELLTVAVERIDRDNLQLDAVIDSRDEAEVLYHRFAEMISRIQSLIIHIKRHEREKRMLTLKALQAQINPHFLYNSLNTVKWMGQMQGADSVVDAVAALSSIMQVNMSDKTYITFREELEYLNQYICMMEFQKAARIKFVCKIEEELKQCFILKMLIQPIVENSLKHGGIMERPDGYVSVSVYTEDKDVVVDVEDNGRGLGEEESRQILENLQEGEGIGLFNIQKRIQLYYGEAYGVGITGEKGIFTCVSLRIPRMERAGEEDDQSHVGG